MYCQVGELTVLFRIMTAIARATTASSLVSIGHSICLQQWRRTPVVRFSAEMTTRACMAAARRYGRPARATDAGTRGARHPNGYGSNA